MIGSSATRHGALAPRCLPPGEVDDGTGTAARVDAAFASRLMGLCEFPQAHDCLGLLHGRPFTEQVDALVDVEPSTRRSNFESQESERRVPRREVGAACGARRGPASGGSELTARRAEDGDGNRFACHADNVTPRGVAREV